MVALPGVLANDSDVDGDALTAVLETRPLNGTLLLQERIRAEEELKKYRDFLEERVREQALGFSLAFNALELGVTTLAGWFFLMGEGMKFGELLPRNRR